MAELLFTNIFHRVYANVYDVIYLFDNQCVRSKQIY